MNLPTVVVLLCFLLTLAVSLGVCGLVIYLVNKRLARKQKEVSKNE